MKGHAFLKMEAGEAEALLLPIWSARARRTVFRRPLLWLTAIVFFGSLVFIIASQVCETWRNERQTLRMDSLQKKERGKRQRYRKVADFEREKRTSLKKSRRKIMATVGVANTETGSNKMLSDVHDFFLSLFLLFIFFLPVCPTALCDGVAGPNWLWTLPPLGARPRRWEDGLWLRVAVPLGGVVYTSGTDSTTAGGH